MTQSDARATVAWAARSAGLEVPERCTPRETLAAFDLARLPRSPILLRDAELEALLAARP